ncbi:MAG TPA: WYL domain-containing protein, partial [Nitrolancea sp.]
WQDRTVRLVYARSDGTTVERLVEPLGLVAKGSLWYLIARVEDAVRTYRVSRVQSADVTGDLFERPADFDLAAYWEQSSAAFVATLPRYPVTLRLPVGETQLVARLGGRARVEQVSEPDGDGLVTMRVMFDTEAEACGCVLSFGEGVEIVEPAALRERVIDLAREVLRHYEIPLLPRS